MLADSEKTRLASVVAGLRQAEADLANSRRELISVEAVLSETAHAGTARTPPPIRELVIDSYRMLAPKKLTALLGD